MAFANISSDIDGPDHAEDNVENPACQEEKKKAHQLNVAVMASAACLILVLCLLSRRRKHCPNLLYGFPSITVPVDVLGIGSSGYRVLYCVVMGSWGADLLQSILNKSLYYSATASITDAVYFFMFSPSVIILSSTLSYFPVFACVHTSLPILNHLTGLLYTSLLVGSNVYDDYTATQGCSFRGNMTQRDLGIFLGSRVWTYFLYVAVLSLFLIYTILDIVRFFVLGDTQPKMACDEQTACKLYVRNLLKRRVIAAGKSNHLLQDSLCNYLVRGLNFLIPNPYLFYKRYPLPLIGAFFMGSSMLVHLVIFCSAQEYILAEKLLHWLEGFQITIDTIEHILPSTTPKLNRFFQQVLSFAKAYEIILPLGSVGAFGFCAMFSLYMLHTTYHNIIEAARGETHFFTRSEMVPSAVYRLASTMRITAFQVGYIIMTWLIYCLLLWILLSIGLLFYYLFNDYVHFGVFLWSWFMIPMMWGAAVYNLQLFLCKYVFLKRRGTVPTIRLKWLYNLLIFVLFFFNAIFGLVMCFLRIFGVAIFTSIMLLRMDWDVYMRGLEGWDTGYRTYMAYMYMEYAYNNLIMRLFVHLLLESGGQTPQPNTSHHKSSVDTAKNEECDCKRKRKYCRKRRSLRACLRWNLAYTLIKNPSLRQYRRKPCCL